MKHSMDTIIVANAPSFDVAPFVDRLRTADLLIAADGGGNALYATGIVPAVVIGDFDSLSHTAAAHFAAMGADLRRFPAEKDETDLELALLLAVERGATRIDILGALGGRWDQDLSNVALLALPELVGRRVRLLDTNQEAYLVRDAAEIESRIGDIISLLPLGGAASGITTHGLRYPLHDATLPFERSRGVSNVVVAAPAHVRITQGMLLVVHQFTSDSHHIL